MAMRHFNTTGLCVPARHYMVDISGRVAQIRAMVQRGDYFCINRSRQYGKTTTIAALELALADEYAVASLDFQGLSSASYASEGMFVRGFADVLLRQTVFNDLTIPQDALIRFENLAVADPGTTTLNALFRAFALWILQSDNPVVLIIDEVDSATNNQVFLDFLAQLRLQYLNHEKNSRSPAFHSVILAGVTDVRHLKSRIRDEDQTKVNSPWNIAVPFKVQMAFSVDDVAGMLTDYEADHETGMNIDAVSHEIIGWTSGYPFLVSSLCQLVDEHDLGWSRAGVDEAARMLLKEGNVSLFESLTGKLENYQGLKRKLRDILFRGEDFDYAPYNEPIRQLSMYGFITERDGKVAITNRIFEMLLYNHLLAEDDDEEFRRAGGLGRNRFVDGGRLDMLAVLEGFRLTYMEVYGPPEERERFCEEEGRRLFLLYLRPIINGTGNYYVEAQTRDRLRTDVIVDYMGERFVVELKIWRGPRYNEKGEQQVLAYMERFSLSEGYMLSFNFNKRKNSGYTRVQTDRGILHEVTV